MKILQIVTKRQYRGAEVFAANLSKELVREGVDIVFVGLYKPNQHPLSVTGARNMDLNGEKSFLSCNTINKLRRLVEEEKPDIVQANGSDTLKYAVTLRLFYPTLPIVYRNISMISNWIGNNSFKLLFYKKVFSQVNHVCSVGHEAVEDLIRTFSYPLEKTSVIRRGIPIHNVSKAAAREQVINTFCLPADSKIVMHVGSFSPEKNHTFLLDVFDLIKYIDNSIKLVLIGEGILYDRILKETISRGLESTVFLLGLQEKVQSYLAAADLFVMGSTVEGVPGVVLEAAAQFVPTVAVDVGGMKEAIIPGETGILLADHNPDNFAYNIIELLNDKRRLVELGENAHRLVLSNFDPGRNCLKFIALYNSLTDNKFKMKVYT